MQYPFLQSFMWQHDHPPESLPTHKLENRYTYPIPHTDTIKYLLISVQNEMWHSVDPAGDAAAQPK